MPEIAPTKPQHQYIQTKSRFPAFVAGFGAGKTEAAVLRSVMGLLEAPGCNRGFYEPTYDLIRMIAFPRFEAVLNDLGLAYTLVKSPSNYINLHGYGNIYFRSMDNPSRIVGYEHADADVDELDTLKKEDAAYVWRQILARNRQKKPNGESNTVGVTTTPEGFRFVYDTWKKKPEMIDVIKGRYADHQIYIYPDASGKARKTVNASLSDISLLESANFYVRVNNRNPSVRDRIMATNAAFEAGRLFVNARACPTVAQSLEQQVYKNGEPDKSSGVDHQNDATTYPIAFEMPIVRPVANVNFGFAL
jgi:hypothetical protein